jgi:hypothetical protein
MNTLFDIIVSPVKTFNQLKTEEKFPVVPFVILLVLALVTAILMVPVNAKVIELTMSKMSLPEKQMDMAIQMAHTMRYLSVIGGIIMYAGMLFLQALILFVIALLFKTQLGYIKALRLIIYCSIVLIIGELVNVVLVYFKGVDNIENMYGIMLTGANLLTSVESAGSALYLFLSYINPFQLWFVVLLALGIKLFTDSGWAKPIAICIIYWLIVTLFPVISAYFSQAAMASKGLM